MRRKDFVKMENSLATCLEICEMVGLKSPPYIGRKNFCLVPLDKSECLLYSISAVLVNKFW